MMNNNKKICFLINSRDYYVKFIDYIINNLPNNKIFFIFKENNIYNNLNILKNLNEAIKSCDIIFSLGYWKIIKEEEINSFEKKGGKIINIHYSYLLKYEGRHTCTWAIQNNEIYHGVTIHYMTKLLDDGPIIDSNKILIEPDDTSYTLMMKCNDLAFEMFKKNFNNIINGMCDIVLKKDSNPICHSYTDIQHEISDNYIINKKDLYNKIRSLTYPNKKLPFIKINDKKIFLKLED
jgi:folate-dependent phosphoribosylglycinamide formyltransferase PurN